MQNFSLQELSYPQPGPSFCKPETGGLSFIFQYFLRSTPFILTFAENLWLYSHKIEHYFVFFPQLLHKTHTSLTTAQHCVLLTLQVLRGISRHVIMAVDHYLHRPIHTFNSHLPLQTFAWYIVDSILRLPKPSRIDCWANERIRKCGIDFGHCRECRKTFQ